MSEDLLRVINDAVLAHGHNARNPENRFRKEEINGVRLPYIFHPFDVAKLVWTWGAVSDDLMKAAIFHDVSEDTKVTYEELVANIGQAPADIVQELSFFGDKSEKDMYLASFTTKSIKALIIKIADRIANSLDFKLSDAKYAIKYWNEANALIAAYEARVNEISSRFGPHVVVAMNSSIVETKNKLYSN